MSDTWKCSHGAPAHANCGDCMQPLPIDLADIPVVILAGGRGARFDHESEVTPKPMIEVCGQPIIQHIVNGFVLQGFREFIVLTGHMHEQIDAHFSRHGFLVSPWTYRLTSLMTRMPFYWVRTMDTGVDSHTGHRIWKARDIIGNRRFVLTYGDGLSNVRMCDVIALHDSEYWDIAPGHPAEAPPLITLSAVNPPGRFGVLNFNPSLRNNVRSFQEKSRVEWINGGFMVCEPEVIGDSYIDGNRMLEDEVLPMLAQDWRLKAYRHRDYWRCMDTRRDREQIEEDVRVVGRLPWMR